MWSVILQADHCYYIHLFFIRTSLQQLTVFDDSALKFIVNVKRAKKKKTLEKHIVLICFSHAHFSSLCLCRVILMAGTWSWQQLPWQPSWFWSSPPSPSPEELWDTCLPSRMLLHRCRPSVSLCFEWARPQWWVDPMLQTPLIIERELQ